MLNTDTMYPDDFITAFNTVVLKWEGDTYTDDKHDSGGATKYGISQKAYPDINIFLLTRRRAMAIYFTDYWLRGKCDKLPSCLALPHFDACVNVGVTRATKLLQGALGVADDGIIGPKTLAAARKKGCTALRDLGALRIMHYVSLIVRHPTQIRFMYGWVRRTFDVVLTTRKYYG